jgi:hypothetical protein
MSWYGERGGDLLHLKHLIISLLTWLSRPNWKLVSRCFFFSMHYVCDVYSCLLYICNFCDTSIWTGHVVLMFNPEVLASLHSVDLEIFICCWPRCTVMFRKPLKGTINLKPPCPRQYLVFETHLH